VRRCVSLRRSKNSLLESCVNSRSMLYLRVKVLQLQGQTDICRTTALSMSTCAYEIYSVFKKELYSDIPNVTAWRVLRKRLHLKAYKLSTLSKMDSLYAFNYKSFLNIRHTVTFGIPFLKHPALPVKATLKHSYSR
jgi:hypothetical protein